jgi:hypothetical protein
MMEALRSSETSYPTRATRRNITQDGILHSHRRGNLKSYIALTDWALRRRCTVFPVRKELGFYFPEDAILPSHRRGNLKFYRAVVACTILLLLETNIHAVSVNILCFVLGEGQLTYLRCSPRVARGDENGTWCLGGITGLPCHLLT